MWGGLGLLTRRVKKQDLGTLACLPRSLPRPLPEWGVCGPVRHVTSLLPRPRPRDAVRCFVRAVRCARSGSRRGDAGAHSRVLQGNKIHRCRLKAAGLPNHSAALFLLEGRGAVGVGSGELGCSSSAPEGSLPTYEHR